MQAIRAEYFGPTNFGMILGVAFLLAVSLILSAALSLIGKWWDGWLGGWEVLAHVLASRVLQLSVLVGLLDTFGKALFPELSYFTLFAPMALVLALKPTGLFGRV